MFIQQLRCNDSVSKLFKEVGVSCPAKSTVKCNGAGIMDAGYRAFGGESIQVEKPRWPFSRALELRR